MVLYIYFTCVREAAPGEVDGRAREALRQSKHQKNRRRPTEEEETEKKKRKKRRR